MLVSCYWLASILLAPPARKRGTLFPPLPKRRYFCAKKRLRRPPQNALFLTQKRLRREKSETASPAHPKRPYFWAKKRLRRPPQLQLPSTPPNTRKQQNPQPLGASKTFHFVKDLPLKPPFHFFRPPYARRRCAPLPGGRFEAVPEKEN